MLTILTACAQHTATDDEVLYLNVDTTGLEKYSYKNGRGDIIIPDDRYLQVYTDTIKTIGFATRGDGNIWAINTKGEELFRAYRFDNGPDYVRDGLFRMVDENGLIGFANMEGEIVIDPQFQRVGSFSEDLASVCQNCIFEKHENPKIGKLLQGAFGFIDKTGKMIIKPQFDLVSRFENGKCKVWKDGRMFYINKNGNEID